MEQSGQSNLDFYRKTHPLPTIDVVNDSSDSFTYRCSIMEEKRDTTTPSNLDSLFILCFLKVSKFYSF